MITSISIENFKGIRDRVEIELRPITLLFGANSAGKSTILHALHYAVELFERNNTNADHTVTGGEHVNLGGFQNLVHGHDLDRTVWLKFKMERNQELYEALDWGGSTEDINYFLYSDDVEASLSSFGTVENAAVELGINWNRFLNQAVISTCRIYFDDCLLAEIQYDDVNHKTYLSQLNVNCPGLTSIRGWITSDQQFDEKFLAERFTNPDETCLSACLREVSREFTQIDISGAIVGKEAAYHFFLKKHDSAIPNTNMVMPFETRGYPSSNKRYDDEHDQAISKYNLAQATGEELWHLISTPVKFLKRYLNQFRYLGPIRELPDRDFVPTVHRKRERWASGLAAWDHLELADDGLIDRVSEQLSATDKLNAGYELVVKKFKELDLADPLIMKLIQGDYLDDVESGSRLDLSHLPTKTRLVILPKHSDIELRPNDVGIGISQVVPVVVTALDDKSQLIAIEQPELHLHPRIQAELGDMFIESWKTRGHTFILETHSEHLILRLLRRIRETTEQELESEDLKLKPSDIGVFYLDNTSEGTKAIELRVDKDGEFIDSWPKGFFDERAKELF
jgi:AAA15 family ATPase/GTPase